MPAGQVSSARAYLGWHLLLQATVLPYAALYLSGHASGDLAYKPAVLGLMLVLSLTSYSLRGVSVSADVVVVAGRRRPSPAGQAAALASSLAGRIERPRG